MSERDPNTVGAAMHRGLITCDAADSLREAARAMVRNRVHSVVVSGESGFVGVLSDSDLLAALAAGEDAASRSVGEIAATDPVTIATGATVGEAALLMSDREVSHLFVLEPGGETPVGVLSSFDLARAMLREVGPEALRILVAHDGRAGGDDAVALTGLLAAGRAAVVAAVAVPFPPETIGDPPLHIAEGIRDWEQLCSELRSRGEQLLRLRVTERLEGLEVATRVVLDDSAARALSVLVEGEDPDLIVVGSSHRGSVGRVLLGATSERLLTGAPCSVAIAPRGYATVMPERLERIGVGFDGSDGAAAALDLAARIAIEHGAELEVIGVVRGASLELGTASQALGVLSGHGLVDRHAEHLRAEAAARIASLPPGVDAKIEIMHGDPAVELEQRSTGDLDLLVVGSRGYGPIRRALLGSVSGRLVRDCAGPLVVATPGVRD